MKIFFYIFLILGVVDVYFCCKLAGCGVGVLLGEVVLVSTWSIKQKAYLLAILLS